MREVAEGAIGGVERIGVGGQVDALPARGGEELVRVVAGIGGDAADLAFPEQMPLIVHGRDIAEVYARGPLPIGPGVRTRQHRIGDTCR